MLPANNNPKWSEFVKGTKTYPLTNLAVKMLASRMKLSMLQDSSEANVKKCINEAYEFFKQNEASAAADIKTIFG